MELRLFLAVAICLAFGLMYMHDGWRYQHRRRLIEDLPTSTARAAAVGPVELKGRVASRNRSITCPLQMKRCVAYRTTIEEYRNYGKVAWWKTVHRENGNVPFFLDDGTGTIVVDPAKAVLDVSTQREYRSGMWRDPEPHIVSYLRSVGVNHKDFFRLNNDMRYRERCLLVGARVYILGTARPVRFDPGRGHRSSHEHLTVVKGERGDPFIISDRTEEELVRLYRRRGWKTYLGAGLILLATFFAWVGYSIG